MSDATEQQIDKTPPAGSLHELLVVAIPLVISSGSLSLMHIVDRIMLTWYSIDALAASTPGGLLLWSLMSFPYGIAVYTNTFVAQYDGAGRRHRVAACVWQGLWMALAFGLLLAVTSPWTSRLTRLFGHSSEIERLEADYFMVLAAGTVPALVSAVLSSFFTGRGKTHVLMVVNLLITWVNVAMNYVLIFGVGPFPELGIRGAAWGTVSAHVSGCLLYAFWMSRERERPLFGFLAELRVDMALLRRMLQYGIPNGVQYLVDVAAYLFLLVFIGQLGKTELAATNLAFNLNSLAFIPLFGIGTAVTTLVGRRVGDRRPRLAIRTTWLAFALASAYMSVWALIYLLLPDVIMTPFAVKSDPAEFDQLRPIVTVLLRYVVIYSFFDAMAVVFGSAIRGAGDTRFSLFLTGIVLWVVMVVPVWVLTTAGGTLYDCWAAICTQLAVLGTGFLWRFQKGKWIEMRVIEHVSVGSSVAAVMEEPGTAAVVANVGEEIGETMPPVHGSSDPSPDAD